MRDGQPNVAKDMVQARLLGALFSQTLRGEIALKGGFAMRVMAGSHRYTKDLDLSASPSLPLSAVQGYVRKAVQDLQSSGLVTGLRVSEPKQTDTTQRWKIGGMVGSSEMHLTVEVSRREELDPADLEDVAYSPAGGAGTVHVTSIGLPSLAAAKVACLTSHVREAPRDVYDLFLLISMDVRPSPEAMASLGREGLLELRDRVWDRLEKMDYETARRELAGYLPPAAARALTEEAWDEMRLVVDENVRGWAAAALDGGRMHAVAGMDDGNMAPKGL